MMKRILIRTLLALLFTASGGWLLAQSQSMSDADAKAQDEAAYNQSLETARQAQLEEAPGKMIPETAEVMMDREAAEKAIPQPEPALRPAQQIQASDESLAEGEGDRVLNPVVHPHQANPQAEEIQQEAGDKPATPSVDRNSMKGPDVQEAGETPAHPSVDRNTMTGPDTQPEGDRDN
jgi:hypothetical protein